jgi:tetratricopeptide (TPR) repeat protein
VSRLRVTPIGTCRIHTPLRRAVARYPIELDIRRNYGFVHTSAEALQLLRYLHGEKEFRPEVVPLLIRDNNLDRFAADSWEPADLHIVEISSGKRLTCGPDDIQLNYLTRHFADFFASRERSRQFWSLVRNSNRKELVEFLGAERSFRKLSKEDRELLLSIYNEQQSFSSIKADMAEITERLGRDRLVFVTHINGRTPDGSTIPSRDRMIRWVKLAARELDVQCFDPTDYLEDFGQQRALEQDGLDLTHYTPAFADHVYDALHRSHVTSLLSEIGEGTENPDQQHAMLAAQLEAMLDMGDFVAVAREVHEALRKAPGALPLVELRGLIRARIGDFAGALEDLTIRGDDTSMSQPMRVALLEALHRTGDDLRALHVAENLLADEFENADIERIASGAAERLGRIDSATAHAKQAFRLDRRDLTTALHALMLLNAQGDTDESATWRAEIIENAGAFETGVFQVCVWAIDHSDEQLFEAAIAGTSAINKAGAVDLLERGLEAGMYRPAALALERLGQAGDVSKDLRKRRDDVVVRAMDEAARLYEQGNSGDALLLARAASGFRAVASRARVMIREIEKRERLEAREAKQRLWLAVREAYSRGDSAGVVAAADGAEELVIANPKAAVLVARSLASLRRASEAIELLKKAHAENPDDFAVARWAGRLAAHENDYATALSMYGSLDRNDPEFVRVSAEVDRYLHWVERPAVKKVRELLDADRIDDALDLIGELQARVSAGGACEKELSRKHRNLRARLIEIEQGEGDIDEREPILRQMVRMKPDDASAHRRLALEYMRQFRFAEAAQSWETLRLLNPDNESVVRNRERCQILARRRAGPSIVEAAA